MKNSFNIYTFFIIQLFIMPVGNTQNTILRFGCFTYENGKYSAEIIYENNSGDLLAGFQFDLQNGIIDSAYGGSHQNNGWLGSTFFNPTFTPTSSRILSFSFGQPYIPADTSVLIILRFTPIPDSSEVCLTNIIMSDSVGIAIPVSSGSCIPLRFIPLPDTIACKDNLLSLGCLDCDSFPGTYHWSSVNANNISDLKNPTYNTNYGDSLFILNMLNCNDTIHTDSFQINVMNPSISILPGLDICKGDQVYISSTSSQHGEDYYWETNPLLEITNLYTASAILNNDHVFYLSSANCNKIDSVEFIVNDCQENIFFIPTAFSPNYDNINDKLFIRGINIKSINFSIYDRYGREVFNANNTNDVWDGAYNGKILGPDVFIYKADVIFLDKESKQFSGNISLIK